MKRVFAGLILAAALLLQLAPQNFRVYGQGPASYFLSPTGSDSNNGTSVSTPWLSPNHSLNCGDTITAAASTAYQSTNFIQGKWGTVTCAAANNVAWLKCVTFDACKITAASGGAVQITANYWGMQGWEATTTGVTQNAPCFYIGGSGTGVIHHIVFANDVANGCQQAGFSAANSSTTDSFDYIAFVGDIAYNAAQGSNGCASGISVYQPIAFDALPGTHIYVAGNFSWGNVDHNPCNGGAPTDGEGIILDTPDGSQGGLSPYVQQMAAVNNLLIGNGSAGLEIFNNSAGSTHANIFTRNNTIWGNNGDPNHVTTWCGEWLINAVRNVQSSNDLAATNATNGCGGNPIYAYYVTQSASLTNFVFNAWGYSAAGTDGGINNSAGFAYGPNDILGVNPNFSAPAVPGAPNCRSSTSVPNCMVAVVADFGTILTRNGYGYQPPATAPVIDSLFPQWLCNVNLPSGLVTPGCLTGSTNSGTPSLTGVTMK